VTNDMTANGAIARAIKAKEDSHRRKRFRRLCDLFTRKRLPGNILVISIV
jgi:hypothetical protein